MVAARGKTGNPGVSNPKKKNSTSFAVEGDEPKAKAMSFRPKRSLYERIEKALHKSGLERSELLELAVTAYLPLLEKSPAEAGQQLEQGQLSSDDSRTEEPAAATRDEAPTDRSNNTGRKEDQASDTKTSSKSKASPRPRTKTRKATSS